MMESLHKSYSPGPIHCGPKTSPSPLRFTLFRISPESARPVSLALTMAEDSKNADLELQNACTEPQR